MTQSLIISQHQSRVSHSSRHRGHSNECVQRVSCFRRPDFLVSPGSQLWHVGSLVAAGGLLFPDQELNPAALHREHGVLSHWIIRKVPKPDFSWFLVQCYFCHIIQMGDSFCSFANTCNYRVCVCLLHIIYSFISLTQWTWVWVNSRSWWWTGRPGVLQFMGSQRVGHDWETDLIWSDLMLHHPKI